MLLAAVDQAAATGFDTHTWQLAWTLDDFLDRRGHWHDLAASQQRRPGRRRSAWPTAAARPTPTAASLAPTPGWAATTTPHTHLRHALDLFARARRPDRPGPHPPQPRPWCSSGRAATREALDHAQQALDLYRAAGHRAGQADALNAVGWYHALLGDHQQALTYCQQALALLQELGDRYGQADTWDSLGYAHHHLGHHSQAVACYQQALDLFRELGDRYDEADTLAHLGDTHHAAGDPDAARDAWQQALTILDELDHPDAGQVRAKLGGLTVPTGDRADE